MRTKKMRLVSALLALAMLFVMMPVGAFADDAYPTEGNCGANGDTVTWKVEQNDDSTETRSMTLTISGQGAMADFNSVPWSNWQHSITKVVINDGVTRICKNAFYYCRELQNVTLSQNLTDIGDNAFEGCSALENVEIPAGVKTIGAMAFCGCEKLSNVTIPNGVTTIESQTFSSCTGLTSIGIPSSVTNIDQYAFYNCTGLSSINIPNSVTNIGMGAFYDCTGLSSITIPSSVTTIGDCAFESCAQLKIYCGAPLKKSGKLSDKGVAEENIIASVTVKLVDGEKTETKTVAYGEPFGTLEKPTKEGYTFVGWYWYDENGNENVFDPAAPLTEDTTICAKWKENAAPTPTPAPAPAPVDDDSVDAGAVAATVVLGAGVAALAYHIGTELYAEQVLGKGVVVPTLRGDVARKAWELAGKPAVTVAGNEAPDEDAQAQQWVVDQGLMKDRKDGKFHPEQWMSKLKALRTLDAAKKLG